MTRNLDPLLAALAALLLALSALAFNACGLGWGESDRVAQPDDIEWTVAPDADCDADGE